MAKTTFEKMGVIFPE